MYRICSVVEFRKTFRKLLCLGLLQFICYDFLDLSNIRNVESFKLRLQLGQQKIVWRS